MSYDLISRQAAIDRIESIEPTSLSSDYQKGITVGFAMAKMAIKEQSPVQPKEKTGRWIPQQVGENFKSNAKNECEYIADGKLEHIYENVSYFIICSNCWHKFNSSDDFTKLFNYCPNCGVKMEGF